MQVIGARKDYSALHLFQAAWIAGCLPGMKDPASDPHVDILWFATAGGKSEAYLGLMLVTLFYARRTGTTAGSLVWARFPLRLLSLQQTERFGQVLAAAEQIRLADPLTAAGEPFAIGYFVGSGNTPNKFAGPQQPLRDRRPHLRRRPGKLPRPGLLPHLRRPRRSRGPRPADRGRRRPDRGRGHASPRCRRHNPGPGASSAWR